jgi:hypothetical protein
VSKVITWEIAAVDGLLAHVIFDQARDTHREKEEGEGQRRAERGRTRERRGRERGTMRRRGLIHDMHHVFHPLYDSRTPNMCMITNVLYRQHAASPPG